MIFINNLQNIQFHRVIGKVGPHPMKGVDKVKILAEQISAGFPQRSLYWSWMDVNVKQNPLCLHNHLQKSRILIIIIKKKKPTQKIIFVTIINIIELVQKLKTS